MGFGSLLLKLLPLHLHICRRRPFLIRGLENTLVKLLLSLEFFDEAGRRKIATGMHGRCCTQFWEALPRAPRAAGHACSNLSLFVPLLEG